MKTDSKIGVIIVFSVLIPALIFTYIEWWSNRLNDLGELMIMCDTDQPLVYDSIEEEWSCMTNPNNSKSTQENQK